MKIASLLLQDMLTSNLNIWGSNKVYPFRLIFIIEISKQSTQLAVMSLIEIALAFFPLVVSNLSG